MICVKHQTPMTDSGRGVRDGPIMECVACTKAMRAKLALLLSYPKTQAAPRKQVVLPPVRMPWC